MGATDNYTGETDRQTDTETVLVKMACVVVQAETRQTQIPTPSETISQLL